MPRSVRSKPPARYVDSRTDKRGLVAEDWYIVGRKGGLMVRYIVSGPASCPSGCLAVYRCPRSLLRARLLRHRKMIAATPHELRQLAKDLAMLKVRRA